MATVEQTNIKHHHRVNVKEFIAGLIAKASDSIGDMIVTVAITGITLAYMMQVAHPLYLKFVPGLYIAGMLVQLFIRIVHRYDEDYTTTELAERLIETEASINERLDTIIRNMMPY